MPPFHSDHSRTDDGDGQNHSLTRMLFFFNRVFFLILVLVQKRRTRQEEEIREKQIRKSCSN